MSFLKNNHRKNRSILLIGNLVAISVILLLARCASKNNSPSVNVTGCWVHKSEPIELEITTQRSVFKHTLEGTTKKRLGFREELGTFAVSGSNTVEFAKSPFLSIPPKNQSSVEAQDRKSFVVIRHEEKNIPTKLVFLTSEEEKNWKASSEKSRLENLASYSLSFIERACPGQGSNGGGGVVPVVGDNKNDKKGKTTGTGTTDKQQEYQEEFDWSQPAIDDYTETKKRLLKERDEKNKQDKQAPATSSQFGKKIELQKMNGKEAFGIVFFTKDDADGVSWRINFTKEDGPFAQNSTWNIYRKDTAAYIFSEWRKMSTSPVFHVPLEGKGVKEFTQEINQIVSNQEHLVLVFQSPSREFMHLPIGDMCKNASFQSYFKNATDPNIKCNEVSKVKPNRPEKPIGFKKTTSHFAETVKSAIESSGHHYCNIVDKHLTKIKEKLTEETRLAKVLCDKNKQFVGYHGEGIDANEQAFIDYLTIRTAFISLAQLGRSTSDNVLEQIVLQRHRILERDWIIFRLDFNETYPPSTERYQIESRLQSWIRDLNQWHRIHGSN